ncbi:fasciclin domain-containing protein [Spirosoma spitsbergense]|uniref:fasciclin domain-containing protein n=1 Tax=Spirosoma spitsbergense TaxID=431554 RepID=UPI0004759CBF|nr:fasciclin domain-containing protein [Spirosoma spitsbergense]
MNRLCVYISLSMSILLVSFPSKTIAQTTTGLTPTGVKTNMNLATSAASAPDHKVLLQYLKASGLLKQASTKTQYTVFAPTDAAFSELPEADRRELLLPSSKQKLIKLLAYHVVKGRITSDQLQDGQTLTNLTGDILLIHKQGNDITIEDGRGGVGDIIQSDIRTTNGIVYSINRVLQHIVE